MIDPKPVASDKNLTVLVTNWRLITALKKSQTGCRHLTSASLAFPPVPARDGHLGLSVQCLLSSDLALDPNKLGHTDPNLERGLIGIH